MATRSNLSARSSGRVLTQSISLEPGAPIPASSSVEVPEDSAPSFWQRIHAIPAEDWANYFCYLYRGRGGASLAKINHAFDPEWVKQRFGGGDYRALLNDQAYKMVASHSFSIEGPPKLPAEAQTTAPAAPSNDAFQAQVLELIRENNRETRELVREILSDRQPQGYAGAGAAVDPNVALKGVIEMLVATMPKQQDPLALLVQLKSLMPTQTQVDPLDFLVKLKTAGLLPDAGAGGSLLEQIEKITEVAGKLGLSATGSKSLGEVLLEKGPDILAGIGAVVDKYKGVETTRLEAAKTIREVQRNAAPPGVAHAAPPTDPAAPPAIAAPPSSALEVEPIGTASVPTSPGTGETVVTEADLVKAKIVKAIANGAGGGDIVSFIGVMDETLLDTFRGVSAADLERFCTMDPILKAATQLPRFKACIAEIVEVLQEEEGEERLLN